MALIAGDATNALAGLVTVGALRPVAAGLFGPRLRDAGCAPRATMIAAI